MGWICGSADLRDLRDLNPRLLVLSPYAVELAPQLAAIGAEAMGE